MAENAQELPDFRHVLHAYVVDGVGVLWEFINKQKKLIDGFHDARRPHAPVDSTPLWPVVLRAELAPLGSASQVSEALKALQRDGELVRLGAGVYAKARRDEATHEVTPVMDVETLRAGTG